MEAPEKQGWLKKRKKKVHTKRWFSLEGSTLYWYTTENPNVKDVKGCLDLVGCHIDHSKHTHAFKIRKDEPRISYTLIAETDPEREEWEKVIVQAIRRAGLTKEQTLGRPAPHSSWDNMRNQQFVALPMPRDNLKDKELKKGILTKKGQQRLFVLKPDRLLWFRPNDDGGKAKAKGIVKLKGAEVRALAIPLFGFQIWSAPKSNGKRESWIVEAADHNDWKEWVAALTQQIDWVREKSK